MGGRERGGVREGERERGKEGKRGERGERERGREGEREREKETERVNIWCVDVVCFTSLPLDRVLLLIRILYTPYQSQHPSRSCG